MKHLFSIPKLYAAIIFYSLFAISSCTKSTTTVQESSGGYINFKANGVQKNYSSGSFAALATTVSTNNIYTDFIGSYKNFDAAQADSLLESISILLNSNGPIVSNTVLQNPAKATATDGSKLAVVHITYYSELHQGYLTIGILTDSTGTVPGFPNLINDGKVVVNELTSTYIKGTFSGTAYLDTDLTTTEVITDGEFNIKRN